MRGKRRIENREILCHFNGNVICNCLAAKKDTNEIVPAMKLLNCKTCGWNPEVAEARAEKIAADRQKILREEKRYGKNR